jgi:hypothetical protein
VWEGGGSTVLAQDHKRGNESQIEGGERDILIIPSGRGIVGRRRRKENTKTTQQNGPKSQSNQPNFSSPGGRNVRKNGIDV